MKRYGSKEFLEADNKAKENTIKLVLKLDSHNFISKEALVEIIKYQAMKNEVEKMTSNEDITIKLNIDEFWLIINSLDRYHNENMNYDWYQSECDYLMDKLFDMAKEQGVVEE